MSAASSTGSARWRATATGWTAIPQAARSGRPPGAGRRCLETDAVGHRAGRCRPGLLPPQAARLEARRTGTVSMLTPSVEGGRRRLADRSELLEKAPVIRLHVSRYLGVAEQRPDIGGGQHQIQMVRCEGLFDAFDVALEVGEFPFNLIDFLRGDFSVFPGLTAVHQLIRRTGRDESPRVGDRVVADCGHRPCDLVLPQGLDLLEGLEGVGGAELVLEGRGNLGTGAVEKVPFGADGSDIDVQRLRDALLRNATLG